MYRNDHITFANQISILDYAQAVGLELDYRPKHVLVKGIDSLELSLNGREWYYHYSSVGGGIVDVTSFALRVCKVLLQRPPVERVLFLDEPFTRPSKIKGYRERVRDMMETVCEDLDFQIVFVTHDEELACGDIIRLD